MILGIGNDIVAINRIKNIHTKFGEKFLKKIYCEHEIDIARILIKENNAHKLFSFLAKRFCAKEAFSKALGIGLGRGINFNDIGIVNNKFGKSEIVIAKNKIDFIKQLLSCENFIVHLSLSDEREFAFAIVIIEKK